jgi:transcriptional regulator with XRE-family HTH domain
MAKLPSGSKSSSGAASVPDRKSAQLGQMILKARLSRRLSREQLADQVGVSSSYIYKLERGRIATPRGQILRNLAEALKVNLEALGNLTRSEEELQLDEQIRRLEADLAALDINLVGAFSQLRPSMAGKRYYVRFLQLLYGAVNKKDSR